MSVQTVGSPPPEADQLRTEIEKQLPNIIESFTQVLQKQFGFETLQVGGFTIVPTTNLPTEAAADSISCDQDGCSID